MHSSCGRQTYGDEWRTWTCVTIIDVAVSGLAAVDGRKAGLLLPLIGCV